MTQSPFIMNLNGHSSKPRRQHGRRGTAYVMVLVVSMIVTVIGVSTITVNRVRSRIATRTGNWVQAQQLAQSAVEQASAVLASTRNWRTVYQHGVIAERMTWGAGSFNWTLLDEADADLADDVTDPVLIVAVATVGSASYTYSETVASPSSGLIKVDRVVPVLSDVLLVN